MPENFSPETQLILSAALSVLGRATALCVLGGKAAASCVLGGRAAVSCVLGGKAAASCVLGGRATALCVLGGKAAAKGLDLGIWVTPEIAIDINATRASMVSDDLEPQNFAIQWNSSGLIMVDRPEVELCLQDTYTSSIVLRKNALSTLYARH